MTARYRFVQLWNSSVLHNTQVFLSATCGSGFQGGASGKEPTSQCRKLKETRVRSLGQEYSPEKGTA